MIGAMYGEESATLEKVSRNDDEMSTISGSSLEQLSLPCSPPKVSPDVSEHSGGVSPVTLADLPSLGSLGHFVGQCSRCCFFPKGRCQNGYECRFCHFEHEKRQRKRKPQVRSNPSAPHILPVGHYHQHFEQAYHEASAPPPHSFEPRVIAPPLSVGPLPAASPHCSALVTPAFPMQGQSQDVAAWPVERVLDWLTLAGLGHLSQNFEMHRITGDVLLDISSSDLDEIGVHTVGDKKRFLRAASELRSQPMPVMQTAPPPPPTPPPYPSPQAFLSDLRPCPPPLDQYQSPFSSPIPATSFPAW